MKVCPYCAHANREGELFCEECGHPFVTQHGVATTQLVGEDRAVNGQRMAWGTARFDSQSSIMVRIQNHADPIKLAPKDELMLGRADVRSEWMPDLDMSSFDGAEMGVSRRHAAIRRGENTLMLVDLGSVNGTHLNGQRLTPNQPRVLRDGDEVRMGKLVFHIYFK
jgi:hypothetical protein